VVVCELWEPWFMVNACPPSIYASVYAWPVLHVSAYAMAPSNDLASCAGFQRAEGQMYLVYPHPCLHERLYESFLSVSVFMHVHSVWYMYAPQQLYSSVRK
jgi:hypothetical protein